MNVLHDQLPPANAMMLAVVTPKHIAHKHALSSTHMHVHHTHTQHDLQPLLAQADRYLQAPCAESRWRRTSLYIRCWEQQGCLLLVTARTANCGTHTHTRTPWPA